MRTKTILAALALFVLALAVRLPRMSQSLWYDEMYTLVEYVSQPWQKVLAAHPGDDVMRVASPRSERIRHKDRTPYA